MNKNNKNNKNNNHKKNNTNNDHGNHIKNNININKSLSESNLFSSIFRNNNYNLNLVLDLDNTIIYTTIFDKKTDKDLIQQILYIHDPDLLTMFTDEYSYYFVYKRPYLDNFISIMSNNFNIYIYTNGLKSYCNEIVKGLKKNYPYLIISDIMYRTLPTDSETKKLNKLSVLTLDNNYEKKTIIIDDRADVWFYNTRNLLLIEPYYKKTTAYRTITDKHLLYICFKLLKLKLLYKNNMDIRELVIKNN